MRYLLITVACLLLITGCTQKRDGFAVPPRDEKEPRYETSECTKELSKRKAVSKSKKIDKIIVIKSQNIMKLYKDGKLYNEFPVSLSKQANDGHKVKDGDGKTPEGKYTINGLRCHDRRYLAMYISYPNEKDKAVAKKLGVETGGYVSIHGQPKWNSDGHGDLYSLKYDWTKGCIGVPNKTMDYLWDRVDRGTPIEILP